LESLESQNLRRENIFEYAGEINCGRTRREEKQRSKPLDFGKSSKDRKKAHAQLGEHNCPSDQAEGKIWTIEFPRPDSSRRVHRKGVDLDHQISLRQPIAIGSVKKKHKV
jgi:hypothetical protein